MPKAAVIDTADGACEAAVRLLARKQRSCAEVREALARRGAAPEHVESAVARLLSQRLLNDEALASDEARALIETKGLSPELAVYKLTSRGVLAAVARQSVEAAREGRTESALCERALQRKLKGRRLLEKDAGKEGRALARLGYEEEIVARVVERAMRGSSQ